MPNVPISPADISTNPSTFNRFNGAAAGAKHQVIKASSSSQQAPSFYSPVPAGSVLGGAVSGTAYSEAITAQGGTSPYTFVVLSGSLPSGLSLSSGGAISGTPSATGTSTFSIQVTDANGYTGTQSFSITVASPASTGGGSYGFVA